MPSFSPAPFVPPAHDSFDRSLWHHTAIPGTDYAELRGTKRSEVVVIGAGYTGLSAAIELSGQGIDVTVVDAREPGFGASGRNGGQVIPAFRYDPEDAAQVFGASVAEGVLDMVSRTADTVFDLIRRFEIQCDPTYGWIQVAHSEHASAMVAARYRQWKERGAPVDLLDAQSLERLIGTPVYGHGALRFRNAGTVQPLSYARGLATAAASLGAQIHSNSRVQNISSEAGGWRVSTDCGAVVAPAVIIASNGYTTPIWPGLRESVVPLYSMQIATDPLPEHLCGKVMPVVQSAADTRRLVRYFRMDRDRRFVIGMRGPFRALPREKDARALIAAARSMYPALADIPFPYRWAGRVAMTADHIPHLHQLAPGVFAGLGYNGRGVGMATMMGRILAAACRTSAMASLPYPVSNLSPIPFHMFHRLGVYALVGYYRMLDRYK